jgi:hypothetical protein
MTLGDEGCGKDARGKDFSPSLGNPANNAGFPLFTPPRRLLDTRRRGKNCKGKMEIKQAPVCSEFV